jgi:energy-coupling factor transporter ATP-binding protein EcfA2
MDENKVTYFAETDARNKKVKFGIKAKDRTRHVYVIGKTGMGKSTLLENMAVQDIQNGEGMCFIDPHGKTADLLLEYVPENRINDVILIAPFDTEYPISFNVLESVDPEKRHLVVSGLMSTFKKIWVDAWSARMEYILTNTLLALLEYPGSTLLGVNKMLSDKEYRKDVVNNIKDPSVKSFWTKEFANYSERMAQDAVPAIQNKVGQFTANPLIRNMIGQPVSSFDFRKAMDSRKIIIVNLSKGRIGDENMKLLGGLLVTKIYLAAMSRADVPDRVMKTLPNFYLFVDEFQNFANASFADILSEARKYKLNLTIAHQYIEQMDEVVRAAVFGNVGTMIAFRVGATDAEVLEKEFTPAFTLEDLVNLGFAQIYLKLMIDGLTSAPFSATTIPPIQHPDISFIKDIVESSRRQFAKPKSQVEVEIIKFHETTPKVQTPKLAITGAGQNTGANVLGMSKPTMSSGTRESTPVARERQGTNYTNLPAVAPGAKVGATNSKPRESKNDAPAVNNIKPISLSALAPKVAPESQKPKQNNAPKQVEANRNALKDALAKALSKSDDGFTPIGEIKKDGSTLKPIPKVGEKKDANNSKSSIQQPKSVNPDSPNSTQTNITLKESLKEDNKVTQKEVPEEVLKKVLRVD